MHLRKFYKTVRLGIFRHLHSIVLRTASPLVKGERIEVRVHRVPPRQTHPSSSSSPFGRERRPSTRCHTSILPDVVATTSASMSKGKDQQLSRAFRCLC